VIAEPVQRADRQISTVLRDAIVNVGEIVSGEIRLARVELGEELGKARSSALRMGIGIFLLLTSVVFALVAVMYALAQVLPPWLAAAMVAVGVAAVAMPLLLSGRKAFKAVRPLRKTAVSVKESIEWARQQMK
jgi:cytochrome c biogenesis protein CcdA